MDDKVSPTFVDGVQGVEFCKIRSLSTHAAAITCVGAKLYTWGHGDKHRLGHGSNEGEPQPRLVNALLGKPQVRDVACGLAHTVVLLVNGQVGRYAVMNDPAVI